MAVEYLGDVRWFSGRNTSVTYEGKVHLAIKEHLHYIANPNRQDLEYTENLDYSFWKQLAEEETARRWDARVAGKFTVALPNWLTAEQAAKLVKGLVAEEIGPAHIGLAIHRSIGTVSGRENLHAHVLFSARGADGKKLRLHKSHLKALQSRYREVLGRLEAQHREPEPPFSPSEKGSPHSVRRVVVQPQTQTTADRDGEAVPRQEGKLFAFLHSLKRRFLGYKGGDVVDYVRRSDEMMRTFMKLVHPSENERIALLLVHPQGKRMQKVVTPGEVLGNAPWLRRMNAKGWNVYISVNSLKEGAKSRKETDFKPLQRAIYLDLDSKQRTPQQLLREVKELGIPPSLIVKSSKGNFQVYWVLGRPVEFERLKRIMQALNEKLSLDHTHDVARVFRLPGLRNKKPGKDDWVTIPQGNRLVFGRESLEFHLKFYNPKVLELFEQKLGIGPLKTKETTPQKVKNRRVQPSPSPKPTQETETFNEYEKRLFGEYRWYCNQHGWRFKSRSELDAAFTTYHLTHGVPEEALVGFLRKLRFDKHDPDYYARQTVKTAQEYLANREAPPDKFSSQLDKPQNRERKREKRLSR